MNQAAYFAQLDAECLKAMRAPKEELAQGYVLFVEVAQKLMAVVREQRDLAARAVARYDTLDIGPRTKKAKRDLHREIQWLRKAVEATDNAMGDALAAIEAVFGKEDQS